VGVVESVINDARAGNVGHDFLLDRDDMLEMLAPPVLGLSWLVLPGGRRPDDHRDGANLLSRHVAEVRWQHQRLAGRWRGVGFVGHSAIELARRVYCPSWWRWTQPEQEVAVRRALAGLARRRLVFRLGRFHRSLRCHWRVP
jgi:hypothetical protein